MSLLSADVVAFERAARERVAGLGADPETVGMQAVFEELAGSSLSPTEISRRAARIAELLGSAAETQERLAEIATNAEPLIRTPLVSALAGPLQRRVYHQSGQQAPMTPSVTPSASEAQTEEPEVLSEIEAEDWHTVLLLGKAREVTANAKLLENRGIKPVRVASLERLTDLAEEQVCGVVVHRSWWLQFGGREALLDFVADQIFRSNLLYLKLDYGGLGDAEGPLSELLEGLDAEVQIRINTAQSAELTGDDLRRLATNASFLRRADRVRVGIEGIDDADRRLIASAIAIFGERRHLRRFESEERLRIMPINEGQSGARVLAIRSSAYRAVVIAKLDRLANLSDEMARSRVATPQGPIASDMCLCTLSGKGVLIQQLLVELDDPEKGAPSLKELLTRISAWERGRQEVPEPDLADLEQGIDRAVEQIGQVNRRADGEAESKCWSTVDSLEALRAHGIRWAIESGTDDGEFDPAEHVEAVHETLASHGLTHVIHGDLHIANVLMLDDRTPKLIDFALAGAGHPCFDLVRFSSGIAYQFIRPVLAEAHLRDFFSRVHIDSASQEELVAEFPALFTGIGPQVALHALCSCRDAALQVLVGEPHERREQYLSMTYLIAAQSLTIDQFQAAVVRGALAAIAPAICGD
jgi:precorrin-6B methylase 1